MNVGSLNINKQGTFSGKSDLAINVNNCIQGYVTANCYSGQPVVLSALSRGISSIFVPISTPSIMPFGIVNYNDKQGSSIKIGQSVGVSFFGACVYLLASEPLLAGMKVQLDFDNKGIKEVVGDNAVLGISIDSVYKGQLARVLLMTGLGGAVVGGKVVEEATKSVAFEDWQVEPQVAPLAATLNAEIPDPSYFTTIDMAGYNIGKDFNPSFIRTNGSVVEMNYVLKDDGKIYVYSNKRESGNISIIG